ncbi:MAG TPA: cobalamin-independent methionine synthase II family protein [Xanthobacteraceae bacterium]|jgi:5-methyltetrahydropteroyltriglutamate--homocysteine methyltransferase|nr:cobalamin-independent methionine synthase II family protein [Xanthobacteraceae bacterium]
MHSTDRILTTHAGSLPRPNDVVEMVRARGRGDRRDDAADAARLREAVAEVVRKQADIGLDIVDDGEFGKPSFVTYVRERLGGLSEVGPARSNPWGGSRDALAFPDFYRKQGTSMGRQPLTGATAPITYTGAAALKTDLENLKAAMQGLDIGGAFVPSISPANIENWNENHYYKTAEEYLTAICDAMHEEYKAIVDAGFYLQIDDPRLVTYYMLQPNASVADCRKWAAQRVEALNYALRDIPPEKVRYHTCYSINMGPRLHDMQAKDIADVILKIHAGAFSFEASNPRHEHEWAVWCEAKKPADTVLIPGVVTHCSVLVEHPELVAERLVKYANAVGRENVVAGTDCGFATFAGSDEIDPAIAWAKLAALVEGAEIASRRLWGSRSKSAA